MHCTTIHKPREVQQLADAVFLWFSVFFFVFLCFSWFFNDFLCFLVVFICVSVFFYVFLRFSGPSLEMSIRVGPGEGENTPGVPRTAR